MHKTKAALCVLIVALFEAVAMGRADSPAWKEIVSPDHRWAVFLRRGYAVGNCVYDKAELRERTTGKVFSIFGPDNTPAQQIGGYEDDSVVWSPGSTFVAVYMHSHRVGEPHVVAISGKAVTECQIPEITLPLVKDPGNEGRWVQDWVKPTRWLRHSVLLLSDSGFIQQQKVNGFRIGYRYDIRIAFGPGTRSAVKSIEQREFVKVRVDE